ncbi:hypothetical protein T07_15029 [Trichinella nelsoni]|uniref:Uncharacterized protein n=1 Tax=Trichinella nelsoni TaxID=6336 RepID=A0A0V0SGU4_9BILA|nr:hypothetical protein T07_15029 [Trichinella nelsoni]
MSLFLSHESMANKSELIKINLFLVHSSINEFHAEHANYFTMYLMNNTVVFIEIKVTALIIEYLRNSMITLMKFITQEPSINNK